MPIDVNQWRAQIGLNYACPMPLPSQAPRYLHLYERQSFVLLITATVVPLLILLSTCYVAKMRSMLQQAKLGRLYLPKSEATFQQVTYTKRRKSTFRLLALLYLCFLCLIQVVPLLLIIAGDVETNPGPPTKKAVLTVENVLIAVKEVYVDWRRFGRELNVPASQIHMINRSGKYRTPKDKTHAVLQYWWDVDPSPSWRRILWALDWGLHAADKIKHNVEPVTDHTLTKKSIAKALETVSNWDGPDGLSTRLRVQNDKLAEFDVIQRKEAIIDYCYNYLPNFSWSMLAGQLYYMGESKALEAVMKYVKVENSTGLTLHEVCSVLTQVDNWIEFGKCLDIPVSDLKKIDQTQPNLTKRVERMVQKWLQNHPAPSWSLVQEALYQRGYDEPNLHQINDYAKQRYLSICEKVMREHGERHLTIMHCIFMGPAGVGKSSLMRRLLGKKLDPKRTSTGIAEKSVQVRKVSTSIAKRSGSKQPWKLMEDPSEHASVLIGQMTSQHAKEESHPTSRSDSEISSSPMEKMPPLSNEGTSPTLPPSESENATSPLSEAENVSVSSDDQEFVSQTCSQHSQFKPTIEFFQKALSEKGASGLQQYIADPETIYMTDTGGQPEFQELLPALVEGPAVFFIVFRLDQNLESRYKVEYVRSDEGKHMEPYYSSLTVQEDILRSFASIASTKYKDTQVKPKVFFIGTFKDAVTPEEGQERIKKLQVLIESTEYTSTVVYASETQMVFTIDNISDMQAEKDVEMIYVNFEKITCHYKVPIPFSWLIFSMLLVGGQPEFQEFLPALEKGPVISKAACFKLAQECGIDSEEEFEEALSFLHTRTGVLRHYREPSELNQIIIRDPQYIFTWVTELVENTFTFQKTPINLIIKNFSQGLFDEEDFHTFTKNSNNLLTSSLLLKLLEHLNVVVPVKDTSKYFMPCALAHLGEATITDHLQPSTIPPLLITFKSGYCPKGVFGELVASIMKQQVLECNLNLDKIFRDQVCFIVGVNTLLLKVTSTYIHIELFPKCTDTVSIDVCDLCNKVRELIEDNIPTAYKDEKVIAFECQCNPVHAAKQVPDPLNKHIFQCIKQKDVKVQLECFIWLPEPTVIQHPKSQSVVIGAEAFLKVKATGCCLQFKWQKDCVDLSDGGKYRDTETDTLRIVDVEMSAKGRYRCRIWNHLQKEQELSHEADLTVSWKFSKWIICGFISALIMVIMTMLGVVPIPWVLAGLVPHSSNSLGESTTINSYAISCHSIFEELDLENAVAEIGDWEGLCRNLRVSNDVLNELRFSDMENRVKKRRCLENYFNTGKACWDEVVKVVANYPFYNRRLAKKIAENHGLDYFSICKEEM